MNHLKRLHKMNDWEKSIIGLGLKPYGFFISIVTFYYYAQCKCGHPVRYNYPDPKSLSLYKLFEPIITFAGNLWLFSLPVALVVLTLYLIKNRQAISWKPIIFFFIGQILILLFFFKSDISEWYFD